MVHQDVPHQLGSDGKEVRPVSPVCLTVFHELHAGLVHERRSLQCVPGPFGSHVPVRDLAELAFHQRDQPVQATLFSSSPTVEKLSNRFGSARLHGEFAVFCVSQQSLALF